MHGSVIFHSLYQLRVSPAVHCWSKRPVAKVVVEYLPDSHFGNDVDDACADFVRWLSLRSPPSKALTFGIANLPGLPWAGADHAPWEWYDRVMAEVATWDPPPVLVDVDYLAATHRGVVLWPPKSRRTQRPPDRRTRPPGEPFAVGWYGQGLEGYRDGDTTYNSYSLEDLPPIRVPLTGTFDWLRAAPEHDGAVFTSPDPAAADALALATFPPEVREARPIGARPDRVAAALGQLLASTPVRLPREFVEFFETPTLWRRIRSVTDCFLKLDSRAVEIRGGLGWLVRFLSDSQGCLHWSLYLSPCGTKHAVVATAFFSGSDQELPAHGVPHPRDITTCAASFEEFVSRFWLENELWYATHNLGPMPVGGAEYLAFYDAPDFPAG